MAEETTADDEVVWAVQLEEEELARLQRAKLRSTTGLSEVDLLDGPRGKELEPVQIGDADIDLDRIGAHVSASTRSRMIAFTRSATV